jgi:hypothetical protein
MVRETEEEDQGQEEDGTDKGGMMKEDQTNKGKGEQSGARVAVPRLCFASIEMKILRIWRG